MTIVEASRIVTGGVDTHLEVHVAAALDPIGGLFGTAAFRPRQRATRSFCPGSGPSER